MKEKIRSQITTECPWRDTLYWYDTIDSTNDRAKAMAKEGAPHGTVLIAGQQTAGRGRMGRSFLSMKNDGVYLSVILRPNCMPAELMHLTCAVGVAMCDAVERVSGIRPGIKWINDLILNKKKLGGILTELALDPKTGRISYAIVGVGINCRQESFAGELANIATSLASAGKTISADVLAAAMVECLQALSDRLLRDKAALMDAYRRDCITLGQEIQILGADKTLRGKALDIDSNGALIAQLADGSTVTVRSGEVSVRGIFGYV